MFFAAKHSAAAYSSLLLVVVLALAGQAGGARGARAADKDAPTPPANVHVTSATTSSVALAWDPSTDNTSVVAYEVSGEVKRSRVRSTRYVAERLECGSSVGVWIVAVDRHGNRSAPANATAATAPCPDSTAPSIPNGFVQQATSQDGAVLAWAPSTDNVGVVSYGVYRGGVPVGSTSEPKMTFTGLSCSSTYAVEVDAVDAAGNRSPRGAAWVETADCVESPPPAAPPPPGDTTPPTAPTGLGVASATTTSVTLTWSVSNDSVAVAGYGVYRGDTLATTVTQPRATIAGLSCGTAYTVGVDAFDSAGNRSAKTTIVASTSPCSTPPSPPPPPGDTTPPSQPASLSVTSVSASTIALAWSSATDDVGVAGYGVYRDGALVTTVNQPEATLAGLPCGTAWTIAVDAFDAAGNRSSRTSVVAATAACPDTTAPTAPGNVQMTSRTANSIAISWSPSTDNVGVAGYGLYRSGVLSGQTAGTTGIFSGLQCNTSYTLAVDAYDAAGNRSPKSVVMISTTACPDTSPPTAPTGLAASNVTATGLTLSWSASSDNVGVTGYEVFRNGASVAAVTSTSTSQSGLACGTAYDFGVSARDAAGNTSTMARLTVTTAACAPSPPPPTTTPSSVSLPEPPRQGYAIPAGAVAVSTVAQLESAIAGSAPDIVLENGTYSRSSALDLRGKNLYARQVGQAVIATGVNLRGGDLYGVRVVVSSSGQLAENSGAVTSWNSGVRVQDVQIDGGNVAWFGLTVFAPNGLIVERLVVRNVLSDGLRMSDNQAGSSAVIQRVKDVDVDTARGAPIAAGTGESGVWIGHRISETVERIRIRRGGWMGLWTGNAARDITIQDLTISDTGPRNSNGVYFEHDSIRITIRRFDISAPLGFIAEWPAGWGEWSTQDVTLEDGTITDPGTSGCGIGIYLDELSTIGTFTVRRVKFVGQRWAAVSSYKPDSRLTLRLEENDYSQLGPNAVSLRSQHYSEC
ncbi:MAG TPA: fibronectin type III domain-containing protein [Gaiellaceae bacterium]|nr:fibronectin type III domain-containing protein [Gaiellaceae bacterium]